jgi:high-affinity iron transporter
MVMLVLHSVLESFVVVLREGIEVSLVVGILVTYLRRTGRSAYSRHVFLGLGAATLASLAAALLVRRLGIVADGPAVEGALMFLAAALVGSLVFWMWRAGRTLKARLEQRLESLVAEAAPGRTAARTALGVFALAFVMVLREGVETILFLTALAGTESGRPLWTGIGACLGLSLAVLFGIVLVRGSRRLRLTRFFAVTGLVLLILVVKLLAGGLHEFIEAGLVPASRAWEEVLEIFTHRTTSLVILLLLVVTPLGLVAWDWWRGAPAVLRTPHQPNGARP